MPVEGAAPLPDALSSLNPEAMLVDESGKKLRLFSDDGGVKDASGTECKDQDATEKQFRSVVVTLP